MRIRKERRGRDREVHSWAHAKSRGQVTVEKYLLLTKQQWGASEDAKMGKGIAETG